MGNIIGRALKSLNPFYILLAFFILLLPSLTAVKGIGKETIGYFFLIVGVASGIFRNPLTIFQAPLDLLMVNLRLFVVKKRAREGVRQDFEKASEEIRRQEREAEECLKAQKDEIEEELRRQRAEAEEEIRRQAEELRRRERAYQEGKSGSSGAGAVKEDYLDPTRLADAYKILGVESGLTKEEYRRAYRELIMKYHPDKTAHLGEELQNLAHKKSHLINQSIKTIENNIE